MARRRFRRQQLRQRLDRSEKSSASRFSPRSNRPAGIEARPPRSSASLRLRSIDVSETTTSKEDGNHKKAQKAQNDCLIEQVRKRGLPPLFSSSSGASPSS